MIHTHPRRGLLYAMKRHQAMNDYVTYFPQDPPVRAAYAVAAIPRGTKVEILMTAAR